ncbi:glycosyltransferase [Aestuariimicrobium soli]|uniref:glycosyltransferase n=1 Tax=Aestuariimicrobium soli TaxID=2035834 RepID=UPI003EBE8814
MTGPLVVVMPGLLNGGGAERYAVGLAAALRGLTPPATAVVLATDRGEVPEFERHFGIDLTGVRVVHLPTPPSWSRRLPTSLFDLVEELGWTGALRRLGPSVQFTCLYKAELPGVASDRNVYVCHFPHRRDHRWRPWWRAAAMAVVARARRGLLGHGPDALGSYDTIVANSGFTANHVRSRWGRTAVVVPPPCSPMEADATRRRQIVAVGRIERPVPGVPNKRHDVLVDAFCTLTDLHDQGWELQLAGTCPNDQQDYLASLRDRAQGAPVTLHPNLPHADLATLYASSTIFWHAQGFGESVTEHPETQEHFGITTVEAMSAGVIPVVIDTAGPREVVAPVAGAERWITLDDLAAATRRVASLTESERASIEGACRARAAEFSPDAFTARIAALLGSDRER